MSGEVEVLLYHVSEDEDAVSEAYHESSMRMAGTPGLLENRLLRAVGDSNAYTVQSRWSDWDTFATWEQSAGHKDQTAPLRPFRDHQRDKPFEVYQVMADYHGDGEVT